MTGQIQTFSMSWEPSPPGVSPVLEYWEGFDNGVRNKAQSTETTGADKPPAPDASDVPTGGEGGVLEVLALAIAMCVPAYLRISDGNVPSLGRILLALAGIGLASLIVLPRPKRPAKDSELFLGVTALVFFVWMFW